MNTKNIEWCFDYLDELNSELMESFSKDSYEKLCKAREEFKQLKTLSAGKPELNNGKNTKYIIVDCKYEIYDEEWEEIYALINATFETYANGKFSNVNAGLRDL